MKRLLSIEDRNWLVVADVNPDSHLLQSERLPVPLQRLQVRRLKDVLLLCRQGFPVGWVVWRMRHVHAYDKECCIELASEFPDIPIFGLLEASECGLDTELDKLDNLCLIASREASELALRELIAATFRLPEQETLLPGIIYKPSLRSVQVDGEDVALTEKEQAVLHYLWSRKGQYVTTEELIAAVWDEYTASDAVRQYIYRLRRKLDPPRALSSIIGHMPGRGYRLTEPGD